MSQNPTSPQDGGVEQAILRDAEAIPAAIIWALLLAGAVERLVSVIRMQSGTDLVWLRLFWITCCIVLLALLLRAVMGSAVIRKRSRKLTISVSIGPVAIWDVKSVPLVELENMVVQERTRGYRGNKIHRYAMLYGREGTQQELLDSLSRENVRQLVHGILSEFFDEEPVI